MKNTQDICLICAIKPGYHADLHVGHVWTVVQCPAYSTLNGADCTCRAGNTEAEQREWDRS